MYRNILLIFIQIFIHQIILVTEYKLSKLYIAVKYLSMILSNFNRSLINNQ